jgi:hypothetical protein
VAQIELPFPDGSKSTHQVKDWRAISGIVGMLRIGERWWSYPPD